jgi:hypothetical protein
MNKETLSETCAELFMTGTQPDMNFVLRIHATSLNHPTAIRITEENDLVRRVEVDLAPGVGNPMDIALNKWKQNHFSDHCPISQQPGTIRYPDSDALEIEFTGDIALTDCQQSDGSRTKAVNYVAASC